MNAEPDARPTPPRDVGRGESPPAPLRFVVEVEARRALSDSQLAPNPERIAQCWERRFIADEARVAEMVQLYRELGYETAVDPIRPADMGEDCGDCKLIAQLQFKMIYTRRGRASHGA